MGGAAALLGAGWALWPSEPSPADVGRRARAAELLLSSPDPSVDVDALLDASDALAERLRAQGEPDVGRAVHERLRRVTVDEPEARSFYALNRERFGDRSFERSRPAVETLVRVHKVRVELDLPDPDNGLRWE